MRHLVHTYVQTDLFRAVKFSRKVTRSNPVTRRPEHRRKSGLKDAEEETSLNKDRACGSAGVAWRGVLRPCVRVTQAVSRINERRRCLGFASRCTGDARCVHNVHQLNRYTTPKKHPSVRRRKIKVYLCQLVTGFPLAGLIHTNGVARKANYGITRNCLTIWEDAHVRVYFSRLIYLSPLSVYLFLYIYLSPGL